METAPIQGDLQTPIRDWGIARGVVGIPLAYLYASWIPRAGIEKGYSSFTSQPILREEFLILSLLCLVQSGLAQINYVIKNK